MQKLQLNHDDAVTELKRLVGSLVTRPGRKLLGLAGGPGVGKSTLALDLVVALNEQRPGFSAYVPMDGFHMRHDKLVAIGIERQKGMPHTFEAAQFVEFIRRLKAAEGEAIHVPGYSREIEDVVDGAIVVDAATQLVVVEGNYLLLEYSPWSELRALIDLAVFMDVPRSTVEQRLLRRHAEAGLFTSEHIRAHVEAVDLHNYDLVKHFGSDAAESGATRTAIPAQGGQQSGDCGQQVMAA